MKQFAEFTIEALGVAAYCVWCMATLAMLGRFIETGKYGYFAIAAISLGFLATTIWHIAKYFS